jgi:hypothetical protein
MATLPCENGGGSINNPDIDTPGIGPYVPPNLCMGDWEITSLDPDNCAKNEQQNQEAYVAEQLNISGAPIRIYPLLGVHQQGDGSVLAEGKLLTSIAYPGYPNTGINNGGAWRSFTSGSSVASPNTFIAIDFGIKMMPGHNVPLYEPETPKWTDVGAIEIIQSNDPNFFARQVKVEIATGECEYGDVSYIGTGDGTIVAVSLGLEQTPGTVSLIATGPSTFDVTFVRQDGIVEYLGSLSVGTPFNNLRVNLKIENGTIPFSVGDSFQFNVDYKWMRVGIFNLIQSPTKQVLNLKIVYKVKAVKITPTLFTGTGNWEVLNFDVIDSPPTNIDNIQDLFFNENRDREYDLVPKVIKAQYTPADSVTDLSKFGLSILDQYTFAVSFVTMVKLLGRPVVVGDILEVVPELQYDQNLKPIRKFLEVTDTGWASQGFSTAYKPTVYRFNAQIALASQETRDIFGTLDTEKYLISDSVLMDGVGSNLNTWPLTATEEINKAAIQAVPETGTDDQRTISKVLERDPPPAANPKGQPPQGSAMPPPAANLYIASGLPPNGEAYGEGYELPDVSTATDGEYFRLYYPASTNVGPRLYRFSLIKNRWIFMEADKRHVNNSATPSLQKILQSKTQQPLGKK